MLRSSIRSLIAALALLPCLAFAGPVDINTATAEQLSEALTGVGPAKAAAIVAYRQQHGPFRNMADLTNVKGVGQSLLDKNQGLILIGQEDSKAAQ
jgi:competence protein ComEA